jgi:two-component system, OmpR family, sensor kinase
MSSSEDEAHSPNGRLLTTLEHLLGLEATELGSALDQASQLLAQALEADKVDVFLYESDTDTLVARGTSDTPLGKRQHRIGMNRLPIANGGRTVEVFQNGSSFLDGQTDRDPDELRGVVQGLGIRSQMATPLDVDGERRGVLSAMSQAPDRYSGRDLRFFEAVSRWIAMLTHRAELVGQMTADAVERGRQTATEELITLLTPRQREIAALIAAGLTNEQIANKLVLTKGTVANHVERILNRLGAERRTQIASWTVERGLYRNNSES